MTDPKIDDVLAVQARYRGRDGRRGTMTFLLPNGMHVDVEDEFVVRPIAAGVEQAAKDMYADAQELDERVARGEYMTDMGRHLALERASALRECARKVVRVLDGGA